MSFFEFEIGEGSLWRIAGWAKFQSDFALVAGDESGAVRRWVQVFSGQPDYELLTRYYGIHSLYGTNDPDLLRAWNAEELARWRSMSVPDLQRFLEQAREFWKRACHASAVPATATATVVRAESEAEALTDDEVLRRVGRSGFSGIDDKDEARFILGRMQEMELWLENEQTKSAARSMIIQEANLFYLIDPQIRRLRNKIGDKHAEHSTKSETEELAKLTKARAEAQSGLEATMKSLGLTEQQNSSMKKKMGFKDCLSMLVEGMQLYYSDGDNALIDTMHTAAEVELLTRPRTLRPAQYRPDIVAAVHEAGQHLWDREYEQTPLGRLAGRKLRAGFERGLAELRGETGEAIESMGEVEGDADAELASAQMATQPLMPSGGGMAMPGVGSTAAPFIPRPRGGDTDAVI